MDKKLSSEDTSLKDYWFVFLIVLIFWLLFMVIMFWSANDFKFVFPPSAKIGTLGVFGDSFNILTSLFTGLAFAGVIISVELQRKELKATRDELEVTRGEIEGQKVALEDQKREMEQQSFDNRFFQMLNSFGKLRETILEKTYTNNYEYLVFIRHYLTTQKFDDIEGFKKAFKALHTSMKDIRHYHINLYQILKLVDRFYLDDIEAAKFYTNIVRAQMSVDEQVILLIHAYFVQDIAGDKLKQLIEKYALLQHVDHNEAMRSFGTKSSLIEEIFKSYEASAFGSN